MLTEATGTSTETALGGDRAYSGQRIVVEVS